MIDLACIICARGGSQGLPNKNIRQIHGLPLIAWSIIQAKRSRFVEDVFVSTDSEEIAEVARDFGAIVPRMRPKSLATSFAGKWEVWKDAVGMVEEFRGSSLDLVVDLDCTSPLRSVDQIDDAIELFINSEDDLDAVFSITPARKNPYFNMVEYSANGYLEISKIPPAGSVVRRQDAPEVFEHVASIYVLCRDYVLRSSSLLAGKTKGFVMPQSDSVDIDSAEDLEWVEYLLAKKYPDGASFF